MYILSSDFKKGTVHLKIENQDDLWYLSHLIDPKDLVRGKTTRKVKIGTGENAKVTKKTVVLTIEAETVELSDTAAILRVNGKIKDGPEDIPRENYHALELEENGEFSLTKKQWMVYQKQKLLEAAERKVAYLFCLFDREEAIIAITKKNGYEILFTITGEVQKKAKMVDIKKDFQEEIIILLEQYNFRFQPQNIILASPAFYKEDLFRKINNLDLKHKIVMATCSDISTTSINEVLRRPELASILKTNRAREEQLIVEELLTEISKDNLATYGKDDVTKAIMAGAVRTLLITEDYIQQKKQDGTYEALDAEMRAVDSLQGKIIILSCENESGKKVNGLGGIAAILRYKLSWDTHGRK